MRRGRLIGTRTAHDALNKHVEQLRLNPFKRAQLRIAERAGPKRHASRLSAMRAFTAAARSRPEAWRFMSEQCPRRGLGRDPGGGSYLGEGPARLTRGGRRKAGQLTGGLGFGRQAAQRTSCAC
jgi:hypothetical protein